MLSRHRTTAGRKRKIYHVLNCPNSVIEKSYDVFCLRAFTEIHQNSRINYFYLSKNDLERLLCCKQNKKCMENKTLSIYVVIILFEKKIICKLVTPGPILSCQLSIKRLFFMSDISSMAIALTVNNRRLSR